MNLLEEFKNYLFSQEEKPSRVTVKNYSSDINHFIKWFEKQYGTFLSSPITNKTLEEYKASFAEVLSPASIQRHLSSLRKFFKYLKNEGKLAMDPFEASVIDQKHEIDLWRLKDFKNNLFVNKAAHLTIKNYIIDVKQFIVWAKEVTGLDNDLLINRLSKEFVEEYKQRLIKNDAFSPATVNRKLSSLRKYLSFAQENGLLTQNLAHVENIKEAKQKLYIPSKEEIKANELDLENTPNNYSKFPPLRLVQKLSQVWIAGFDAVAIAPLVNLATKIRYVTWKLRGQPIFEKGPQTLVTKNITPQDLLGIKNLSKSIYAPFKLSTQSFSSLQKVIFHLRYTRPNWYKRYHSYAITHYFHFAVLVIFLAAVGFGIYNSFFAKPQNQPALAALPTAPPRILSFQGRLTDNNDNPITSNTNIRFAIYNNLTASGAALLWQEVDPVTPDVDGIFNAILGNVTSIPSTLFSENAALYLGVTIEATPELTPRQQLATVAYATNSETLQGLPPSTAVGASTSNVVLALDSSGNLTIGGSANPVFSASGGQFKLSGQPLLLTTNTGTDANVQITTDDLGKIDLQKPILNSTNSNNITTAIGAVEVNDLFAVLATSSGQSAVTINQTSTGPIISASSGGTAKFTVDNSGNEEIAGNLTAAGTTGISLSGNGAGIAFSGTGNHDISASSGTLRLGALTLTGAVTGNSQSVTGLNNLSAAGTITFSNFNANNNVLYATVTTGVLAGANTSTTGLCLVSGASAPSWSSCSTATTDVFWSQANGTLYANNSTVDLLIGGQATTSAKFAVLNINSGIPVASVSSGLSGTSAYLTADGTLGTQNRMSLTIGNSSTYNTTGNVLINPNGTGNVGIGTTGPSSKLDVVGGAIRLDRNQFIIADDRVGNTRNLIKWDGASDDMVLSGGAALSFLPSGGSEKFRVDSNSFIVATHLDADILQLTSTMNTANQMRGLNVSLTASAATNSFVGKAGLFATSRTNSTAAQTLTDSGNILDLSRTTITNNGTATTNVTGTLLQIANTGTQTLGTLTDTSKLMTITQNYTSASGVVAEITNAGTGASLRINDDGTTTDSTPFIIDASGNVAIGATSALAALDVRGLSGTTPVASVSGQTSFAALVVDNKGVGDIFTASSSGLNRFVITQAGNVGIGNTSPLATLDVRGNSGTTPVSSISGQTSFATLVVDNKGVGDIFTASTSGYPRFTITNQGNVAMGKLGDPGKNITIYGSGTAPSSISLLGTSGNGVNLTSGYDGVDSELAAVYGLTITAGNGTTGDITFRSKYTGSYVNQLRILGSNGNVGLGTTTPISELHVTRPLSFGATGKALAIFDQIENQDIFTASASGVTKFTISNTGALTDAAYTNAGGILYTSTTGLIGQTAIGTSSQCLIGGTTPAFGSCATGGTDSPFQVLAGAIVPLNSTLDLLLGGQATISAKFAVLNINSGTPTASISSGLSGTSAYLTADGTLGTQNRMSLTIGNSSTYNTTGNVLINPNGTGNVGIGTTSPTATLYVTNTSGTLANFRSPASGGFDALTIDSSGNISTAENRFYVNIPNGWVAIGSAPAFAGLVITPKNTTDATLILQQAASQTGDILQWFGNTGTQLGTIQSGGNVGIGDTTPDAKLEVLGTTEQLRLTYADGTVDSRFTVDSSGNLNIDNTGTKTTITDDLQVTGNDILDSGAATRITLGATTTLTNTTTTLSGTSTLTASSLATVTSAASLGVSATTLTLGNGSAATLATTTNGLTLDSGNNTLTFAASDTILTASGIATVTLGTSATINAGATALNLQADGTPDVNIAGGSGTTGCTIANATGNLTCSGTISGSGATGYWNRLAGNLFPATTNDTISATTSASVALTLTQTGAFNALLVEDSASDTTPFVIDQSGKVGIGTTTPISTLDVNGDVMIRASNKYYFAPNGSAIDTNWSLGYLASGAGGTYVTVGAVVQTVYNGSNAYGYILKNSGGTPLFEIGGGDGETYFAGNVGIKNTARPVTALDVNGSASLSANLSLRGAATAHTFNILDNGTLNIQRSPSGDAGLASVLFINSNGNINVGGDTTPDSLLSVGSTSQFQVNSSGAIAAVTGITTSGGYTQSGTSTNTLTGATTISVASSGLTLTTPTNDTNSYLYLKSKIGSTDYTSTMFVRGGGGGGHLEIDLPTTLLWLQSSAGRSAFLELGSLTGNHTFTFPDADGTFCLQNSTSCGFALGSNYWGQSSGLLYPLNSTVDFAIGGQSTTSAKFAVLNVNGTGPATASISGNLIVAQNNGAGGAVAIGGTSVLSGYRLDVQGATNTNGNLRLQGARSLIFEGGAQNEFTLQHNFNDSLALSTSAVSNVFVVKESSGNVGIGTTSPGGKLAVEYSYDAASQRTNSIYLTDPNNTNMKGYIGMNRNSAAGTDKEYLGIEAVEEGVHWMNIVLAAEGGNVGIGTTSPGAKLEVAGAVRFANNVWNTSAEGQQRIYFGTSGSTYYEGSGHIFRNAADSADLVTIQNGGNVGIGTTAPRGILDVYSTLTNGNKVSSYYGPAYSLTLNGQQDNNATSTILANAYAVYNSGGEATYKWVTTHASFGSRGIGFSYGGASTGIKFYADSVATTADSAFTPTARMIIQNDGSVGIGTTGPTALLDVAGTASVGGQLTFRSGSGTIQTTAGETLVLGGTTTGLINVNNKSGSAFTTFDTVNSRVGIGTTTPISKLDVRGLVTVANTDYIEGSVGSKVQITQNASSGNTDSQIQAYTAGATAYGNLSLQPSGGSVGIGTTNPQVKLDIIGGAGGAVSRDVLREVISGEAGIHLSRRGQNAYGLSFGTALTDGLDTTTVPPWAIVFEGDALNIRRGAANQSVHAVSPLFTINNAGNVGIGDTSPDAFLEVLGTTEQLRLTYTDGTVDSRFTVDSSGNLTIDASTDGTGSETLTLTGFSTLTASSLTTLSLGTSATINAGATALNLQADGTPDVNIAGGSSTTGCTIANSTGNLTCSGAIATTATTGTQGWLTRTSGNLYPSNTNDTISATTSAGVALTLTQTGAFNSLLVQDETSDTTPFVIDQSGNVGIGTTAPTAPLEIGTNVGTTIPRLRLIGSSSDDVNGGLEIGDGGTVYLRMFRDSGNNFRITTGSPGNGDLYFMPKGNVGIGTTSPASLLEVGTNVAITSPRIKVLGSSDTVPLQEWGDGGVVYTRIIRTAANTMKMTQANFGGAPFVFDGTYSFSGNVGIGNTTPLTALDVTGSASLSANLSLRGAATAHTFNILDNGTLNIQRSPGGDAGLATALFVQNNGNVGIGTMSPQAALHVQSTNVNDTPRGDIILAKFWNGNSDTRASSLFHYYDSTQVMDKLVFGVAGSGGTSGQPNAISQAKMVIQANGNVGIGTTTPGYKLQVEDGNIAANNSVTSNGAALMLDGVYALHRTTDGILNMGFQNTGINFRINSSYDYPLQILSSGNVIMGMHNGGKIGFGTTTPTSELHVTRPLSFGATGKALAIFDQIENQDILTASAGGVAKFTITNPGGIKLGTAEGSANNCLLSGGAGAASSWGACTAGGGVVTSVTGTANQITASPTTGAVVLSIPSDFRAPGTVNAVSGLYTGATAGTQRIDANGAVSNITTIGLSGAITGATATNTINNIIINAGAVSGVTTLTSSGSTTIGTGASTNTVGAGASSVNTIGSVTTPGALTLHGATTLDNTFTVSGSNLTSLGGNLTVTGTAWTATPTISGLITATSGVSVAASQSYTGAGAVTLSSGGGLGLTLDSGSNTLTIAASDTTLTASGIATVTLGTSATINAGATALNLQADGTPDVNIAGGSGTTGCTIANATGNLTCSGTITGTGATGYWNRLAGNLFPATTNDTISATTSASVALTLTQTGAFNALLVQDEASDTSPFVIDQSGNVGIGTTAPASKLNLSESTGTVHGAAQGSFIIDHENSAGASSIVFRSKVNRGSDYGFIQYQDAATVGGGGEAAQLIIGTSNDADDHLILQPAGNVGIGTTVPGGNLEIASSDTLTRPALRIRANTGQAYGFDFDHEQVSTGYLALYSVNNGVRTLGLVQSRATGKEGNVGIGTTGPNGKLTIGNNVATGFLDTYGEYQIILYDGGTAASSYGLGIKGGTMVFNTNGAYSFDRTGSATSMYIDSSGNVGIGTTGPLAPLHVTRPLTFGTTGKALAIFDQIENQDILTASKSGVTQFTVQNDGDITAEGTLTVNGGAGDGVDIVGTSPTVMFKDTDNRTGYIHMNSDILYVLSGVNGSGVGAWAQVGGQWPLMINTATNNVTIGGDLAINGGNITTALTTDSTLTVTGTLTANGTLDANGILNLGDGGDAFTLATTTVDITAGAVSGVTTLAMTGAITGATATNTINSLIINAGALSGITTITTSGNINSQSIDATANFTGTVAVASTLTVTGAVAANGGLSQDGNTVLNGTDTWLRTTGATGWYSTTYAGGWYMTAADYISTYNSRGVEVVGKVTGKALVVLDETGNQDILTASASGVTQFRLTRTGGAVFSGAVSGITTLAMTGALSGVTTITASSEISGSYFTSSGGTPWHFGRNAELPATQCGGGTNAFCFQSGTDDVVQFSSGGQATFQGGIAANGDPDIAENIRVSDQSINSGDILTAENYDPNEPDIYQKAIASKTTKAYDQKIIGTVSENPGLLINSGFMNTGNLVESNQRAMTIAGRVPVKVSQINGNIKTGDSIVTSDIPGVGMKSTKPSTILGTALTDFVESDATQSARLVNGNWQTRDFRCNQGEQDCVNYGKVLVLVTISWQDPDVMLTSTGDLNIIDSNPYLDFNTPHIYVLNDPFGLPIGRVGAFADLAVAKIRAGFISAQQISTNSLTIASSNVSIAGQSLYDYISAIVSEQIANISNLTSNNIVSPIASIDTLKTGFISPVAQDSNIGIKVDKDKIEIVRGNSATNSAVASFDSIGNATFSGILSSRGLEVKDDASISGTLRARRIIADQIEGLDIKASTVSANYITNVTNVYNSSSSAFPTLPASASGSTQYALDTGGYISIATFSSQLAYVENLNSVSGVFSQNLSVFGNTTLSDTSVVGQLAVGGSLILANNSINVLGSDLALQPLRQGGISIMAGIIYIDTNGNVKFGNDATVNGTLYANQIAPLAGKDLTFKLASDSAQTNKLIVRGASNSAVLAIDNLGNLIASGAGSFAKLNINSLVAEALAVSPTEMTATGSAGTAKINAGRVEMTINNPLVTENSLIYITPTSNTQNQVLYLLRQVPGESFTVGIQSPTTVDIPFNWIIVN